MTQIYFLLSHSSQPIPLFLHFLIHSRLFLSCFADFSSISHLFGIGRRGFDLGSCWQCHWANEPARVTRHNSRLVTLVSNGDEELEVEEEDFEIESSDEQDDINVVELRNKDERNVV
ncbi:unnamed protein product [Vicia faba]|uniref:Uncharacterized protein n=1 Tax=Vicia faba TaxID=3906 RepID=A0AAV0ZUR7_VICFA|nr:unnamed protein product [Vicia faba]